MAQALRTILGRRDRTDTLIEVNRKQARYYL